VRMASEAQLHPRRVLPFGQLQQGTEGTSVEPAICHATQQLRVFKSKNGRVSVNPKASPLAGISVQPRELRHQAESKYPRSALGQFFLNQKL
jgi:hypothetical protein